MRIGRLSPDWKNGLAGLEGEIAVLNVCGGHERTISHSGLRGILPPNFRLIPGPGCPVCVCPGGAIRQAMDLAMDGVVVVAFGDLLRVPVHGHAFASLDAVRAATGNVRPVGSPQEAVVIAQANPGRQVVFFAAGFETTMAPVAAGLVAGYPENLSLLLAGRRTWPIVAWLLRDQAPGFNAVIAPGHVSAVMGAEEWRFLAEEHGLPVAVAGFEPEDMALALLALANQKRKGEVRLDNAYGRVVRSEGNRGAQRILDRAFSVVDSVWRGIGEVPDSGYAVRPEWGEKDARVRFGLAEVSAGDDAMPPGCRCADVVLGRLLPDACPVFGRGCNPSRPVGPCMVSDEGACHIWWQSGMGHG